jgi:predicted metal-dependent phosphoesterase TrpH
MPVYSVSEPAPPGRRWVKADLHVHSAEDPLDEIHHDAAGLLHRAKRLGFDVIAITLHDHVLLRPELSALAEELGILLIPAGEIRIEGADVVILNITPEESAGLKTFADLRELRRRRGDTMLTIAPHVFYVIGGSIGRRVVEHIDCFDAIEYCHFHTTGMNLNHAAVALARKHARPLVATSDAHRLRFFGDNYSLAEVPERFGIADVFAAIRADRLRLFSPPWPLRRFLSHLFYIGVSHPLERLLQRCQG